MAPGKGDAAMRFIKGKVSLARIARPGRLLKTGWCTFRTKPDTTYFDVDGIEASLTNLLSNAMDAVILRGEKDGRVILHTRDEDGDLIFEVEDNGCGMDWEVKQRIFTTFFTTKGGEGTGLGLLTTRKIV